MSKKNLLTHGLVAAASCLVLGSASAAPVTWTDWTSINASTALGSIGGVAVTATGGIALGGRSQTACGTNYWTQPNGSNPAYTDGIVDNAPDACEQVGLIGPSTITVTFASAINDLVMALVRQRYGSYGKARLDAGTSATPAMSWPDCCAVTRTSRP